MSSALTIGGWFASACIESAFDHLSFYAIEELARQSGLHKDVGLLRNSIKMVRGMLNVAKKRKKIEEESLVELLMELKDVARDGEDVLDELQYEALRRRVEDGNQASNSLSSSLKKVNGFLFDGDDIGAKIRDVQERLDNIIVHMHSIISLLRLEMEGGGLESKVNRVTTSLLTERQVFGRDEEKDSIIDVLLKSGDGAQSVDMHIGVISLVGIGGVGKTTLAQYVYNDRRVKEFFTLRMWVCVSENFNVERITREIMQYASGSGRADISNLNILQEILCNDLKDKRFLLVLDDMWDDVDCIKWERLRTPLLSGAKGCKILITTRLQKIAFMMGVIDLRPLKGLQDDVYWSFFKKCAFADRIHEEHPKLEIIGKTIAKKLGGSPLAAKTVGGLLKSNLDEMYWRSIMESEIWKLQQNGDDIMQILILSYQHLPGHLKLCFAYCSLFPKGHVFKKLEIVRMWMAQGFIKSRGNMRAEDVGCEYFDELLYRSFFQLKWNDPGEGYYIIHDLMHDLAEYVSLNECLRIEDERLHEFSNSVRHLSVYTENLDLSKLRNFCALEKLQTLLFHSSGKQPFSDPYLFELLKELRSIRVLILHDSDIQELPTNIYSSKHLRYLDISGTRIQNLPESFCSLFNLQVFVMESDNIHFQTKYFWDSCHCMPKDCSKLINLRHIIAYYYRYPIIAGVGSLTSLQELKLFKVKKQNGHRIRELQNLLELRRSLRIENLENVGSKEEASEARLNNKRFLEGLELHWADSRDASVRNSAIDYMETLEGIQPHANLRSLRIESYWAAAFPSWLLEVQSTSNLEVVQLIDCRNLEHLPSLGQLPFLKSLELEKMNVIKQIGNEFYGAEQVEVSFPSLERLAMEDMPELQKWFMPEGCRLFCHLPHLRIQNCPKIGELLLPQSLPAIEAICITSCEELVSLPVERFDTFPSFNSLELIDCPKLGELLLPQSLPALEYISITKCQELVSLPVERFKYFTSLKTLRLRYCPKLKSMAPEEIYLPSSLQNLHLESCGGLDRLLPGWVQNLTSLFNLTIHTCPHIETLRLHHLTRLKYLEIEQCDRLRALSGLFALTSLKILTVAKCPMLTEASQVAEGLQQGEAGLSSILELYRRGCHISWSLT